MKQKGNPRQKYFLGDEGNCNFYFDESTLENTVDYAYVACVEVHILVEV